MTEGPQAIAYQGHSRAYLDLCGELCLVLKLDGAPLLLEVLVISVLAQPSQQVEVIDPGVCAQGLCDERGQARVAPGQPPPGCHAVRLVLELVGRQLIKVLQGATMPSQQLCMESCRL